MVMRTRSASAAVIKRDSRGSERIRAAVSRATSSLATASCRPCRLDPAPLPLTACRALTSRLISAIRRRSGSVVNAPSAGSSWHAIWAPGAGRDRRARRLPAERVDADRRELEADRPREVEHLVHEPVEPRHLAVDVRGRLAHGVRPRVGLPQRMQRRLDDHQRVAHFVRDHGRQAAERAEPLLLRHLALKARDRIGQRVEGGRQQPGIVVVPAVAVAERDLARQVAGRGNLAHHVGDGRERLGDGTGDREAEQRRQRDREHRRQRQAGVNGVQRLQLLGARAQDQRDRPGADGRFAIAADRERARQRLVLAAVDRQPRDSGRAQASRQHRVVARASASRRESGRPCRMRCRCR